MVHTILLLGNILKHIKDQTSKDERFIGKFNTSIVILTFLCLLSQKFIFKFITIIRQQ